MSRTLHWIAAVTAALVPAAATTADTPPARLAETGLHAGGQVGGPIAPGNLPFAPQYPLWTDGASKRRWIRVPPGTAIDASRPDDWQFPVGTRFWKQFSFAGRPVETRMIERLGDGTWRYATYVFDADGRDARLAPAAGVTSAAELAPGVRHAIPAQNDCRACHEGRPNPVLGFGLLQLSPDRDPGAPHAETPPEGALDLRALVTRGLVRGLPAGVLARPPRIPAATAAARAALGYLHGNCGHCHNDDGPLAAVGLTLDQRRADAAGVAATLASTVLQPSTFRSAGGPTLRIAPGQPALGVLVERMASRHPVARMPPLGTALVDEQAVALLARWITQDLSHPAPSTTHKETRP